MTRAWEGSSIPGSSTATRSPGFHTSFTRILAPDGLTFSVVASSTSHGRSRLEMRRRAVDRERLSSRPPFEIIRQPSYQKKEIGSATLTLHD
jgi:hypothetical protein